MRKKQVGDAAANEGTILELGIIGEHINNVGSLATARLACYENNH
jgi:hypothetical protein